MGDITRTITLSRIVDPNGCSNIMFRESLAQFLDKHWWLFYVTTIRVFIAIFIIAMLGLLKINLFAAAIGFSNQIP